MDDEYMPPTEIETPEPRNGASVGVTMIGVLDIVSDQVGVVVFKKSALDDISSVALPLTTCRFSLAADADAKETSDRLESALLENGMESLVLSEEIEEDRRQGMTTITTVLPAHQASRVYPAQARDE